MCRQPKPYEHPYTEIAVCSNGSIGYRPSTGEQLWRHDIPSPSPMGNAWDDVPAAADAVTRSVEDGGFAAYLDQLGLLDRPTIEVV